MGLMGIRRISDDVATVRQTAQETAAGLNQSIGASWVAIGEVKDAAAAHRDASDRIAAAAEHASLMVGYAALTFGLFLLWKMMADDE